MRHHDVTYVSLDVVDTTPLKAAITAFQPDVVINLVSMVTAVRDASLFETMMDHHTQTAQSIYEALKEYQALSLFVHIGSLEEYGNIEAPFREDAREAPNSPYALAKQMTTNFFLMMHRLYGFRVTVWRLANLFGHHQNAQKFLPYVMETLRKNEPLKTTHGHQRRDFLSTAQLSLYVGALLETPDALIGEIINLGSGEALSLRSVIEGLKEACESSSTIDYGAMAAREDEPELLMGDYTKLQHWVSLPKQGTTLKDMIELMHHTRRS